MFSKDAVWVQSTLLCRNHYYTPVPAFVLNNIQKIPGHQFRETYKKYLHQQFSIAYKKYLVMSQGHSPIVSKGCGGVESILLCRNHYNTPVPAFVLKGVSQSSYAGYTTLHLLVKTNNL